MTTLILNDECRALSPYERAVAAEDALGILDTSTSGVDLLNVIRAIVDDLDHLSEEDHRNLIADAFNHFVTTGGVDYSTDVGELYYSTVRDAVTNAMEQVFPAKFDPDFQPPLVPVLDLPSFVGSELAAEDVIGALGLVVGDLLASERSTRPEVEDPETHENTPEDEEADVVADVYHDVAVMISRVFGLEVPQ
jgi:hypothetical protein